jgi:hypothetical protein
MRALAREGDSSATELAGSQVTHIRNIALVL